MKKKSSNKFVVQQQEVIRKLPGLDSNNIKVSSNNFDFVDDHDDDDDDNDDIYEVDSLEIKNWRYHLTNNRL